MHERLSESQNECKRHLNNYIQVRNQYNSYLESHYEKIISQLESQGLANGKRG